MTVIFRRAPSISLPCPFWNNRISHIRTDATTDRQSFSPRRFSHWTSLKIDRRMPRLPALTSLPPPLTILSSQLNTARMVDFPILNGLRGALIHRTALGAGRIGASISWLKNFCHRSHSTIAPLRSSSVGVPLSDRTTEDDTMPLFSRPNRTLPAGVLQCTSMCSIAGSDATVHPR